jgi:hypothetical protein
MSTLSMRIVTYLIKYLSEFEFKFETILDNESGDQMGSFDEKNMPSKISCLGTFKPVLDEKGCYHFLCCPSQVLFNNIN